MRNECRKCYDVEYRLDDIEDYDNTEYESFPSMLMAQRKARELVKEYGNRLVLLDILIYDEYGWLIDSYQII